MPVLRKAQFGELERAILEVLWGSAQQPREAHEALSVREVQAELATTREIAYTTVMTVLDRLVGKSLVEREKISRAFHYRAVHSRHEMTVDLMNSVLGEFSQDSRELTLLAFVRVATTSDRDALRAALDELDDGSDRD